MLTPPQVHVADSARMYELQGLFKNYGVNGMNCTEKNPSIHSFIEEQRQYVHDRIRKDLPMGDTPFVSATATLFDDCWDTASRCYPKTNMDICMELNVFITQNEISEWHVDGFASQLILHVCGTKLWDTFPSGAMLARC